MDFSGVFTNGPIRFVVCAYRIPQATVDRFIAMNDAAFRSYGAILTVVTDATGRTLPGYAEEVVYPVKQDVFNFSKTINYGIRNGATCGTVVKTDIDIIIPAALIGYSGKVSDGAGLVHLCADVPSVEVANARSIRWPDGVKIMPHGHGGYFALSYGDWSALYGYDERMYGWGTEDKNMFDRASRRVKMEKSTSFPLFHIHHPKRLGKFFPYRSGRNHEISKRGRYVNPEWGSASAVV